MASSSSSSSSSSALSSRRQFECILGGISEGESGRGLQVCCGGEASELPVLPGLEIDGNPIALPLIAKIGEEEAGAQQFVALGGSPSPHGKGLQTVIDPDVRSSLEISPEHFRMTNPKWQPALDAFVERICGVLIGSSRPVVVRCEPYKLLLYRPGDHFLRHR